VIGFHAVVRVLLADVPRGRDEVVDDARVDRCPLGADLDRLRAASKHADEPCPCSTGIAAFAEEDVDDLPCWSTARYR
jgi:hypothetical protein